MKKMRRIVSLVLAMVMVFAMSANVFAAETYTITAPETEHQYEIYQIFIGDYSEGVLSNIKWGENGAGKKGEAVSKDVLDALEAVSGKTDAEKLAEITKYANLDTTPVATITNGAEAEVAPGYYLIKDKDNTVTGNDVYTTYIVKVVGDVTIQTKSTIPTVDKVILDPDATKVNEASIGEKVNYKITGTLPENIADYKEYYYKFTDTLSKGLTYNDDIKVTVGGVDVTKYFYKNATTYSDTTGTTITVAIKDLLALKNLTAPDEEESAITITKDTTIVITYSATLNENAVIAGEGNPNDVKLTYSNDPNHSGNGTTGKPEEPTDEPTTDKPTGETPKVTVVTYVTELTITKTDGEGNILTGAEFTLTSTDGAKVVLVVTEQFKEDENGTYYKLKDGTYTTTAPTEDTRDDYDDPEQKYIKTEVIVAKGAGKETTTIVGEVDEQGRVTFRGLGAGTYTITETKTPAGYNTIAPITFTISFDEITLKFSATNGITLEDDNTLATTIVNLSGAELPSTGGIGTTIFYVVGAILVVGAAVVLITRRRMDA